LLWRFAGFAEEGDEYRIGEISDVENRQLVLKKAPNCPGVFASVGMNWFALAKERLFFFPSLNPICPESRHTTPINSKAFAIFILGFLGVRTCGLRDLFANWLNLGRGNDIEFLLP
jgi:hypothetical protein